MLNTFKVQSSLAEYTVNIDDVEDSVTPVINDRDDSIILIDSNVLDLYAFRPKCRYIAIDAIEENKTLDQVQKTILDLKKTGCTRDTSIIAIGGGIIQDLSTFIASIYMRGLTWEYHPTTLLSMVDSAIGGKSSLNIGSTKNLVGNYYPPQLIKINANYCKTLAKNEMISGIFEAIKITYVSGDNTFNEFLQTYRSIMIGSTYNIQAINQIITLSLLSKKKIIQKDEFDKKERKLLNFGHTFGHAIESATSYKINHGISVGLGILVSGHLYRKYYNQEPPESYCLLEKCIRSMMSNINSEFPHFDINTATNSFASDKKHSESFFRIITACPSERIQILALPKTDKVHRMINSLFERLKEKQYEI
jgi:3-dehydroquinate synthase